MPNPRMHFQTISEVAEWLEIQGPCSAFLGEQVSTQVKPIKRAGRAAIIYRPTICCCLRIKTFAARKERVTIKGVQKVLREEGMGHVARFPPLLKVSPQRNLTQGRRHHRHGNRCTKMQEQPHEGVVLAFESRAGKASKGSRTHNKNPVSEVPRSHTAEADTPNSSYSASRDEAPAEASSLPHPRPDKGIDEEPAKFLAHPIDPLQPVDATSDKHALTRKRLLHRQSPRPTSRR